MSLSKRGDPKLPAGSIDVLLLSDVYMFVHRQEDTKDDFVKGLFRALKPGGVLVITYVRTTYLDRAWNLFDYTLSDFILRGFEAGRRWTFVSDTLKLRVDKQPYRPIALEFRKPKAKSDRTEKVRPRPSGGNSLRPRE